MEGLKGGRLQTNRAMGRVDLRRGGAHEKQKNQRGIDNTSGVLPENRKKVKDGK